MVEVLNVNFERQFDGIVNAIQKATFIGMHWGLLSFSKFWKITKTSLFGFQR